jgi:hypothetical protein
VQFAAGEVDDWPWALAACLWVQRTLRGPSLRSLQPGWQPRVWVEVVSFTSLLCPPPESWVQLVPPPLSILAAVPCCCSHATPFSFLGQSAMVGSRFRGSHKLFFPLPLLLSLSLFSSCYQLSKGRQGTRPPQRLPLQEAEQEVISPLFIQSEGVGWQVHLHYLWLHSHTTERLCLYQSWQPLTQMKDCGYTNHRSSVEPPGKMLPHCLGGNGCRVIECSLSFLIIQSPVQSVF